MGNKKISAEKAVLTSLFVDFLDVLLNLIAAIFTGSIVMIAETIHGVADSISVGFVYIGLKRSKKKPDKKHPFGYGKVLYVWIFISGIIMFGITSILTFYFGFMRFLDPKPIKNILLAIIVLLIFIGSNGYSLSVGVRRILNKNKLKNFFKLFKESNLVETKTTITLDLIGTCAAILGLISLSIYYFTGNLKFDGLGAMSIGITLGVLTIFLLFNTKQLLIGKRAPKKTEDDIIKIINSNKYVNSFPDLKTMNIGLGKIFVVAEINVKENLKTKQIEKLIDKIKQDVKDKIKEIYHIQIEIESKN